MTDHRIKALTSITGVNFGRLIREGFSNFDQLGRQTESSHSRSTNCC
ncbi:hypothetical protein [Ralstonia pickettii]|nr:hypothetical protein N234_11990 [Ralstonia pickettii DTP0602]